MDLKQVNDTLNTYIRPQTFPVAIKVTRGRSHFRMASPFASKSLP